MVVRIFPSPASAIAGIGSQSIKVPDTVAAPTKFNCPKIGTALAGAAETATINKPPTRIAALSPSQRRKLNA
jgi:hypothetical protein